MSEFSLVTTIDQFRQLDDGDLMEGYLDGVSAAPEPGSDRSRAYWHGWCNGRVDAGLMQPHPSQILLNEAFASLAT